MTTPEETPMNHTEPSPAAAQRLSSQVVVEALDTLHLDLQAARGRIAVASGEITNRVLAVESLKAWTSGASVEAVRADVELPEPRLREIAEQVRQVRQSVDRLLAVLPLVAKRQ